MNEQPRMRQIGFNVLAVVLWLLTVVLAFEAIYILKEIFYLIYVALGGSADQAERFVPGLVFLLALGCLVFIVWTTEYHLKKVGHTESWRLFGWSLAVELSLLILYYFLL